MLTGEKISDHSFLIIFVTLAVCILAALGISYLNFSLPVVIILGAFAFLVAFTNTNYAMIWLIFSMLLSPEFVVGEFNYQRDVVIRIDDLLIVVFTLAWFAKLSLKRHMQIIVKTPINRYIAFYIFVFVFSTLFGMIKSNTLSPLKGTFYVLKYIEYFIIFFLAARLTTTKAQVKLYLKTFIITFAIVNIYAFLQIGAKGRVSAPFEGEIGEPNTLGGYQVLLLAIILGLITHMKSSKWKFPLIFLSAFSIIPFIHTLSRSSYLSIIPMYLVMIFFNKTRMKNILIGILFVLIILSFFFFPQNVKNRIANTFVAEYQEGSPPVTIMGVTFGPSASARINDYFRSFNNWKKSPLLGYGLTAKGFLDSQYIGSLVELGTLGLLSFLMLLISIYRTTLRIYLKTKDKLLKGLALGFLAGHVGMMFHAITANTFIIIRIMEPYWFLAAMVMVIPNIEENKTENNNVVQFNDTQIRPNMTRMMNYGTK